MSNQLNGYIKIKDFGRDRLFPTVNDLKKALSEQYKGQHVSIVYQTKPSGLTRTVFVSVDDAGGVNSSYGDQASVDFAAIEDELYVIDCAQEASA